MQKVEKYNFKEEKKKEDKELKEFFGDADEESGNSEVEELGIMGDVDLKTAYMKLLRNAKKKGVPANRAVQLVDEIMQLYNTLVDTGYTFTTKTVLARSLKFFYNKIG